MDNTQILEEEKQVILKNPFEDREYKVVWSSVELGIVPPKGQLIVRKVYALNTAKEIVDDIIRANHKGIYNEPNGNKVEVDDLRLNDQALRDKYTSEVMIDINNQIVPQSSKSQAEVLKEEMVKLNNLKTEDEGFAGLNSDPMEAKRAELIETPWMDLKKLASAYSWYDTKMNKVDTIEMLLDEESK